MTVEEVIALARGFRENWLAALLVLAYYLAVLWPRIRSSLGDRPPKSMLEKEKLIFEVEKLRYETAALKKEAAIDPEVEKSIETEIQARLALLGDPGRKLLTPLQTFVGVPVILATVVIAVSELYLWTDDSSDTIAGAAILVGFEIVVFWGYPMLRKYSPAAGRRGAMGMWGFLFFVLAAMLLDTIDSLLATTYTEDFGIITLLLCIAAAVMLGRRGKLPGTRDGASRAD